MVRRFKMNYFCWQYQSQRGEAYLRKTAFHKYECVSQIRRCSNIAHRLYICSDWNGGILYDPLRHVPLRGRTARVRIHRIYYLNTLNENAWISIKISQNFFPRCSIDNIAALVQKLARRRPGDKCASAYLQSHVDSINLGWDECTPAILPVSSLGIGQDHTLTIIHLPCYWIECMILSTINHLSQ